MKIINPIATPRNPFHTRRLSAKRSPFRLLAEAAGLL